MLTFHVRPHRVVINREIGQQIVQMLLPKNDELRQAFEFYCLNKSFASAVQIWTRLRKRICPNTMFFQLRHEFLGEFRVLVVHHDVRLFGSILGLFKERFGLPYDPCRIGMFCRG